MPPLALPGPQGLYILVPLGGSTHLEESCPELWDSEPIWGSIPGSSQGSSFLDLERLTGGFCCADIPRPGPGLCGTRGRA